MKTQIIPRIILMLAFILPAGISSFATTFSVDVRNFEFSPSDLPTVRIGDTIHWEWKAGDHTTTSTSIPAGAAAWDQPISVEFQSYEYVPTVLGTYNYVCTPHVSMGMTGSFTVTAAAGIPNGSSPVSLSLYPNPASDRLMIRAKPDANSRIESVKVLDASGKVVREFTLSGADQNLEMELSLEGLPSGLLIFEFRENTGVVSSRKIIRK